MLTLVSLASNMNAQTGSAGKVLLKADGVVSGPIGGQKSRSCLRIYADGTVIYAKSEDDAKLDRAVAFAYQLRDVDAWELSSLLKSKAVRRLAESFAPPHKPVTQNPKAVPIETGVL
jgi:hypothetical protein